MNNIYFIGRGITSRVLTCAMAMLLIGTTTLNAATAPEYATQNQQPRQKQDPAKKEVKGSVVDSKGQPIIGAAVLIKGVGRGTATDTKGNFVLAVPATGKIDLEVSFMGMKSVTMPLAGVVTGLRVVLQDSAEDIDEVVVTGMEVIKKDHLTGSASVLTSKDLQMQGITSIDRILEGKIAGLNSTTISGAPGARAKITIRGENNLSGNTEPLWIVDGLPMLSGVPKTNTGDFAGTIMQDGVGNIMPEDIESIAVLKDAAAAAIYGARAANGVIVITTKKGYRSKTSVRYSGSYETSTGPRTDLGFMNSQEKLRYEKSIVDFFGLEYSNVAGRGGYLMQRHYDGYMTDADFQKQWSTLENTNTDWYKEIFRNSHSHSHNVNISGGTEQMTYYTSINLNMKDGILRSNKNTNAGVLFKIDYRPIKNLVFEVNVSANTRKNVQHASSVDPFNYAIFANPYEKPFNEDGSYASDHSYLASNYTAETISGYKYADFNIIREMELNTSTQKTLDADITFRMRYDIIKGFNFESVMRKGASYNMGMREISPETYTSNKAEPFANAAYPSASFYPSQYDNGSLNETAGNSENWSMRNQLNYSFSIKSNHSFSFLVANEITSKKTNNFGYTSPMYYPDYRITGVPVFENNPTYEQMRSAIGNMFTTSDLQSRTVSFLGNARYSYKDRYVVNFSYRADGADIIGDSKRFTPLWSVGGRYNLHNEKWFKNKIITTLGIKASYGYTGNIDRSALPFSTIKLGSDSYLGDRFISGFTYPNPSVTWEKKRNINFGVDMGVLNGRVNVGVDYYLNRTSDVLTTLNIPTSTGRSSVRANGGIVENSGIEVYINVNWVKTNDISFSTSFNAARNKNIIVKSLNNYTTYKASIASSPNKGGVINIIGQETGSIFGWQQVGINPLDGTAQYMLSEDGKREFAYFLDGWEGYSDANKAEFLNLMGGKFGVIPDYVSYKDVNTQFTQFLMPSIGYLGRQNPLIVGGFSTSFRYKRFDFSTDWTFKVGHIIPSFSDLQNAPNNSSQASSGYTGDLSVSATNRQKKYLYFWKAQGDITTVPTFKSKDNWSAYQTSEKYEKGDYLRMTNISVNYNFPSEMLEKVGISRLSLGCSARNLLTFTKYRGIDVATGNTFGYPVAKEFNIKLSVGF